MSTDRTSTPADLVVRGGRIRTLDGACPVADAIAVRGSVVTATGGDAEAQIGPPTRVVELEGRTAVPGINDAHLHGAWLGARWPRLFFDDAGSPDAGAGPLVRDEAGRRRALLTTWSLLASLGITSYTEPGIGPGEDDGETGCFGTAMLDTYVSLHRARRQTSRVTLLRLFGALDGESDLADLERGLRTPAPRTDPRWLAITGVKIFADGIPPMRSAWVREPYLDGSTGSLLTRGGDSPLDAFRRMIALAHERGLQVAVHATGDRAIAEFVAVVEGLSPVPAGAGGHYVVHADLVTDDLLRRMAAAGIGIAMQPLIAEHSAGWSVQHVGAERAAGAWPLSAMLAHGVRTTVTSDAPIANPDWRASFDAALRLAASGGRDDAPLRERMLRAVTVDAAAQDGAASFKGTLAPGMAADVCVLDEDPLEPGRAVAGIGVAATIVDGRVVYDGAVSAPAPPAAPAGRPDTR